MLALLPQMSYLRHMPEKQQSPMTTAEVAEALNQDARTIQRKADAGEIPSFAKLPGRTGAYLFDRAVIEDLVSAKSPIAPAGTSPEVVPAGASSSSGGVA